MLTNDDLYGDLPENTTSSHIDKLESQIETLNQQVKELTSLLSTNEKQKTELIARLDVLKQENEVLLSNISSLFKTARAELGRKANTIQELRTELEDRAFRRHQIENPRHKSSENFRETSRQKCDLSNPRCKLQEYRKYGAGESHQFPDIHISGEHSRNSNSSRYLIRSEHESRNNNKRKERDSNRHDNGQYRRTQFSSSSKHTRSESNRHDNGQYHRTQFSGSNKYARPEYEVLDSEKRKESSKDRESTNSKSATYEHRESTNSESVAYDHYELTNSKSVTYEQSELMNTGKRKVYREWFKTQSTELCTPLKLINNELRDLPMFPNKLVSPIADTPDHIKEKLKDYSNSVKVSPVPMLNERRVLDNCTTDKFAHNKPSPVKPTMIDVKNTDAKEEISDNMPESIFTRVSDVDNPTSNNKRISISIYVEHGVFKKKRKKLPVT